MNDFDLKKCALFGALHLLENHVSFIGLCLSDYDEILDSQINDLHAYVNNLDFCLRAFKGVDNENK